MFDWNDLRHFIAVFHSGSLSAAARHLGVAQPTVGRRIDELESRLSTCLFERSSSGLIPTPSAHAILRDAMLVECSARTIAQLAQEKTTGPHGIVIVTAPDGLAACWLAKRIPRFREQHPAIQLELAVDVGYQDLLGRQADLALRIGNPGDEELVGRVVGHVKFGLYLSPAYREMYGAPESVSELRDHVIIESANAIGRLPQVQHLRMLFREATVGCSCDSLLTQVSAAIAGAGLLAIPEYIAAHHHELERVLPDDFAVQRELWLLKHAQTFMRAEVRAVQAFLMREISEEPLFAMPSTEYSRLDLELAPASL